MGRMYNISELVTKIVIGAICALLLYSPNSFSDNLIQIENMDFLALSSGPQAQLAPLDLNSPAFHPANSWSNFSAQLHKVSVQFTRMDSTESALKMATELGEWQALSLLSEQSEGIWQKMLECNDGDGEVTRKNYFLGKICEDQRKDSDLIDQIKLLHSNVFNLLNVGHFYIPKPTKRPKHVKRGLLNLNTEDRSRSDINMLIWHEVNKLSRPIFHPLLTQVIFEYFGIIMRLKHAPLQSVFYQKINKDEPRSIEKILDDYMDSSFSTMTTSVRTSELAYWEVLKEKKLLDSPQSYQTARMFINSWLLVSAIAKDSCQSLGLWPEMTFALLVAQVSQIHKISHELARVIREISCLETPRLDDQWTEAPYKVNDKDIVRLFRRMGQSYGFKLFDKVECIYSIRGYLMPGPFERGKVCYTLDPAAPDDVVIGKSWARGEYHPKLLRFKQAESIIDQQ